MMAAAVELVFVAGHPVMECHHACQAAFDQQLQCAVNSSKADLRVFFAHQTEQFIGRKMVAGLKKCPQDGVTLLGMFQPYPLQVLIENFLGLAHVFTRRRSMIVNPSLEYLGHRISLLEDKTNENEIHFQLE